MTGPADVPPDILDRLRAICLALPETYEEPAWIGTRWRIRQRTFAHGYAVESAENACALTFRAPGDEFEALISGGHPFYRPGWGTDVVRMALDGDAGEIDWEEITELLTDSYCVLAPKRLAAKVSTLG
ncbi:MAG TPA: MmcQ/YjbR family DNA-binding protein [Candidatus Limnocylindrales bacterium]